MTSGGVTEKSPRSQAVVYFDRVPRRKGAIFDFLPRFGSNALPELTNLHIFAQNKRFKCDAAMGVAKMNWNTKQGILKH